MPLTAYVLISLLEAGESSSSATVSDAVHCLKSRSTQDLYTLVLNAYAFALSGVPDAEEVMTQLISQAVETSSTMYWDLPAGASMYLNIFITCFWIYHYYREFFSLSTIFLVHCNFVDSL